MSQENSSSKPECSSSSFSLVELHANDQDKAQMLEVLRKATEEVQNGTMRGLMLMAYNSENASRRSIQGVITLKEAIFQLESWKIDLLTGGKR